MLTFLRRDDEHQGESNSITNQKRILEGYANHNGFTNIMHITDDGFSGTNFEREGWKRLISEVEAGMEWRHGQNHTFPPGIYGLHCKFQDVQGIL